MPDDLAKCFSENLAHYRERAGMTQEELAARAEIHRTQIGALLGGKQLPRLDTLVKLAGALGVPPGDLIAGMNFEPAERAGKFNVSGAKRKK